MRYDELTLPLGASELRLRFHSRFTVLAGLNGTQRRHFIDGIAQLNRGALHGGSVTLVDGGGRRQVIDGLTGADPATHPQRSAGAWRSLLAVGAEDLGLPRASDDPGRLTMQSELASARLQADQLRGELSAARDERRRHAAEAAELVECEARLADLGTEADRHRHNRARALVELEEVRASLVAVGAPPSQIAHDTRLVDTTAEVHQLATEWADIGERLDRLEGELRQRPGPEDEDLAGLVDIPDEIPESLAAAVAERDRLRVQRDDLKAALARTIDAPTASMPTDVRVLTLAALDQETLWLTHRDVLLVTEALHTAQRNEQERMLVDPTERELLERAHATTEDAVETADRRWLPSVLVATLSACAAAMLLVTDLWITYVPALLAISLVGVGVGVGLPRLRVTRARQREQAVLAKVGAADIADYLAQFSENPDSKRWQRAEQLIEDYQAALGEWRTLVGDITPADATLLEESVHAWVARTDRPRQEREITRIRRDIDHTSAELSQITNHLTSMLEPFGLDPQHGALAAALQDRVLAGRAARLRALIADTREAEAKLTHRLETELAALGFEAGSLSARISAYGRELDAARQRVRLRLDAPEREVLEARIAHLEARLATPAPEVEAHVAADTRAPDPAVVELRSRRDRLARRTAAFTDPDTGEIKRRLHRIEGRIAGLETSLATERGLVVANPVDHLVETLIRYRPAWPTTEHEPAPALLDDPFAATGSSLKRQLLDAVVEVARVVQIILLTDDRGAIDWARDAERRGLVTLIEPATRRR